MVWIRIASVLFASTLAASAVGYEVVEVSNGGAIKGRITASGSGHQDETRAVNKDNETCGDSVPAEKLLVSGSGGLKNAVVMLDGVASGKAFASTEELTITNDKCRFVPHVSVAPKGGMMKVRNDDPVLHNSHFYLMVADSRRNVINLALPKQGLEIGKKKILRKPGLLSVECDAHDFMQAWLWVVENPYAAVTDAEGAFSIEDVPPGSYKARVWHEAFGEKTADVTVEAGKPATLNVAF